MAITAKMLKATANGASKLWKSLAGMVAATVASGIGATTYASAKSNNSDVPKNGINSVELNKLGETELIQLSKCNNIYLKNASQRPKVKAKALWQDSKGTCIYVMNRPACLMCRLEAKTLLTTFNQKFKNNSSYTSNNNDKDKDNNVRLIAIVNEERGVSQLYNQYFPFEIYLDSENKFYNQINKQSFMSYMVGLIAPQTYHYWRNFDKNDPKLKTVINKYLPNNNYNKNNETMDVSDVTSVVNKVSKGSILCIENGNKVSYINNERVFGDKMVQAKLENALDQFKK